MKEVYMLYWKRIFLINIARLIGIISAKMNLGAGGTWPGEIALNFDPKILSYLCRQLEKIILIAGTNGKTTTAKMIETILKNREEGEVKIAHNATGANLLNGITSALIQVTSLTGKVKANIGVFEVDEASLPLVLKEFIPDIIILLNLFRDQLDRYGEVDILANKWLNVLKKVPSTTNVIINADDPHLSFIGTKINANIKYFGIEDKKYFLQNIPHAADSIYCPNCGDRLKFAGVYLSHLGQWHCSSCNFYHPKNDLTGKSVNSPLAGVYNIYNSLAAVLAVKALNISEKVSVKTLLEKFKPAFGRQEEFYIDGKKIKIFLSKNPAGFNASLQTILELGARQILFVLNDRIPDGRDISWIWDVDFEMIPDGVEIIVSGDRVYDMALRIKYAQKIQNEKFKMKNYPFDKFRILSMSKDNSKLKIYENLKTAIDTGLKEFAKGETLYILPTYSAMLEVRRILRGRKIL